MPGRLDPFIIKLVSHERFREFPQVGLQCPWNHIRIRLLEIGVKRPQSHRKKQGFETYQLQRGGQSRTPRVAMWNNPTLPLASWALKPPLRFGTDPETHDNNPQLKSRGSPRQNVCLECIFSIIHQSVENVWIYMWGESVKTVIKVLDYILQYRPENIHDPI